MIRILAVLTFSLFISLGAFSSDGFRLSKVLVNCGDSDQCTEINSVLQSLKREYSSN